MEKIEVKNLVKTFHNKTVLNSISFDVKDGEFMSILGPSGCGKTTLLRLIIGIENADSGSIFKDGVDITGLESSKRGMGIVFQNYALFPNMTVLQNVKYALRFNKELKDRADEIAKENIEKVGLSEFMDKKPAKLSGGQQQRVAIARTLALSPDIMLFDEPMSALDAAMRVSLRKEIKEIQEKSGITMIYITHDQEEAFAMSDRIMVMNEGTIMQIGTPGEVYHHPANQYVEEFVTRQIEEKLTSLHESVDGKMG